MSTMVISGSPTDYAQSAPSDQPQPSQHQQQQQHNIQPPSPQLPPDSPESLAAAYLPYAQQGGAYGTSGRGQEKAHCDLAAAQVALH